MDFLERRGGMVNCFKWEVKGLGICTVRTELTRRVFKVQTKLVKL
jgi:hypothetical protein